MVYASPENHTTNDKVVFWGCFTALVTTSFGFFSRLYLCNTRFPEDFGLEKGAAGSLAGAGIWPFAISIILSSLIIDRVGYRVAMLFSFICYAIYLGMSFMAYQAIQGVSAEQLPAAREKGYDFLYWGSVILALGNGTVESFINPVVATMFHKEKTKWLNILHAGWPGGLMLGGIITIALADEAAKGDWRIVVGIIALPALIYLALLIFAKFPISEREQAGVSYKQMLAEFGGFGAFIGFGLIAWQLAEVFPESKWLMFGAGAAAVLAFIAYTQSFGRLIMAYLIIIMMPLAVTEIGTDGWITGLMQDPMKAAGYNAGWVLVYTAAIMTVLRFFAGPIVHTLSPIGLLIVSSALAVAGLFALSKCGDAGLLAIFAAATLYGVGKTFFWPTMLGITSEQCPKGGALTLNAISGIGMIAVGVLGFPFIGAIQEDTATAVLREKNASVAAQVVEGQKKFGVDYEAINPDKAAKVTDPEGKEAIAAANKAGQFNALAKMAMFPTFMLLCYLILFLYFKSRGGYKAQDITHGAG
ncbi:MAG TPA: MFS transporter [Gemmataceae bacterium]|nr:MFS transporter [Gemmataceae bacterium]